MCLQTSQTSTKSVAKTKITSTAKTFNVLAHQKL